jgi:hypothetical protein
MYVGKPLSLRRSHAVWSASSRDWHESEIIVSSASQTSDHTSRVGLRRIGAIVGYSVHH